MSKLSGVVDFVQVAQAGSFVAAGRALGISASAVGKSIARLEARLDTRLFHRSTRSLHLTAEGSLFLARCLRVIDELDAAESELSESAGDARGRLRVSLPVAGQFLFSLLADFMQAYPAIQLEVDFSDRLVDVIEEGFDVVIRTGSLSDSRLVSRALGTFDFHLVAAPEYLRRTGTPMTVADLAGHACLFYRLPSSGRLEAWPLGAEHEAIVAQLQPAMTSNSVEMIVTAAVAGRGLACLPDFAVRTALKEGTLQVVLADEVTRTLNFNVLWTSHRFITPKLRCFVDFVSRSL